MHDDQLTRLLRQIDEPADPDSAFADRLFNDLSKQVGRRRGSGTMLMLVAAVMLVALLAVGAAVGSGLIKVPWFTIEVSPAPSGVAVASESATPSATASATASATPAASPSPSPAPTPVLAVPDGLLPPGSTVTVMVDGLRVRQQPSTSAPVVTTLAKGDTITIFHSIIMPVPVIVEGVRWYSIEGASRTLEGWVAAEGGGTPFLALAEPTTCEDLRPGPVTLQQLIAADSWHRLACLGDMPVTVTGVYVLACQGGATDPSTFGPHWLIDFCATQLLTPQEGAKNFPGANALDTVTAPELGQAFKPFGTIARVTGHFDDPASTTCFMNFSFNATQPAAAGAAALDCQEQFVVTKIEVLGSMTLPPI
jgi:hypothetical protein